MAMSSIRRACLAVLLVVPVACDPRGAPETEVVLEIVDGRILVAVTGCARDSLTSPRFDLEVGTMEQWGRGETLHLQSPGVVESGFAVLPDLPADTGGVSAPTFLFVRFDAGHGDVGYRNVASIRTQVVRDLLAQPTDAVVVDGREHRSVPSDLCQPGSAQVVTTAS